MSSAASKQAGDGAKVADDAGKKNEKPKRRVGSSDVRVATAGLLQYSPEGNRFTIEKLLGKGAYGAVYSAKDRASPGKDQSKKVALKHVMNAFTSPTDARRIFREIHVMAHFDHPNIVRLMRVLRPQDSKIKDFVQLYLVTEVMETDLHRVIHSRQDLTSDHISYFLYQLLCGLKHLHSGGVLHRDLKPSNLLVNADCQLKVCDFGLARESEATVSTALTEYVVTRWYRAPEVLLSGGHYKESIDVWSVGCILGELLLRRPLFPGENYLHQLQLIIQTLGSPAEEDLHFIRNDAARDFVLRQPHSDGISYSRLFPHVRGPCLDLIAKMLVFDPDQRISIDEALAHPFLARVRAARKHVCEYSAPVKLRMRHRLRKMSIDQIRDTFAAEFMTPGRWDGVVPAADRQHAPSRPLPPAPPSGATTGSARTAGSAAGSARGRVGQQRQSGTVVDMTRGMKAATGQGTQGGSSRSGRTETDDDFHDLESPSTGSADVGIDGAHGAARPHRRSASSSSSSAAVAAKAATQTGRPPAVLSGTAVGASVPATGSSRSVARATAEAYLRRRAAPGGAHVGATAGAAAGAHMGAHVGATAGAKRGAVSGVLSPEDEEEDSKPVRRGAGKSAVREAYRSHGAAAGAAVGAESGVSEDIDDDDDDDDDEFFDAVGEDEEEEDHAGGAGAAMQHGATAVGDAGRQYPAGTVPPGAVHGGARHHRGGKGGSGSGSGFYNAVDDSVKEAQTDEYWSRAQQQLDQVLQKASSSGLGLRSKVPTGAIGTAAGPAGAAAGGAAGGSALQSYQYDGTSAEYREQGSTLVQVPEELSTPEHEKPKPVDGRRGLGLSAAVGGAPSGLVSLQAAGTGHAPIAGRRAQAGANAGTGAKRPGRLAAPDTGEQITGPGAGGSHFVAAPARRNDGLPRSVSPMRSPTGSGSAAVSSKPFGGSSSSLAYARASNRGAAPGSKGKRVPIVPAPRGMGSRLPGERGSAGAVSAVHPDALSRQVMEAARQGHSARSAGGGAAPVAGFADPGAGPVGESPRRQGTGRAGGAAQHSSPALSHRSGGGRGGGGSSQGSTPARRGLGSGGRAALASGASAGFTPSPAASTRGSAASTAGPGSAHSEAGRRQARSSLSSAAASMLAGTGSPRLGGH